METLLLIKHHKLRLFYRYVKLYTFGLKLLLTASCDLFTLFWSLTYNLETVFLDPALVQHPDFDLLIHYAMEEKRVFQLKSNI